LDWLLFFSDTSKLLTIGIVSVVGIIVGSALVALATRTFRWEGFGNAEDLANHLVGGVLMGVGGVTALGCTIGQGLPGASTLSLGSMLALAAIIAGGVAAWRRCTTSPGAWIGWPEGAMRYFLSIEELPVMRAHPQRDRHRRIAALTSAALLSMPAGVLAQAATPLQTQALAATCANCHGTAGQAFAGQSIPRLAGLSKEYIVTQMQAFRDGSRPSTVMQQLALGYSQQQIETLAAFFAAQK
jgi:cytochrome c553